ncbi:MAG: hypothetical protein Satyrvirus4_30 [Satyrvirus sp.]|uniref:Uncharacterized protein n=1 Tax=Satyrvirus sp. TaxID=2487771 RepID=A0A3G5AGZ4_9VIRU|nr:MAG: hypothetical protein Satyrvirus4_30 [Satyrvirus sp.]
MSDSGLNKIPFDIESLDPFVHKNIEETDGYSNPFYLDANGSKLKFTKTKILFDEYKYVYILCLADNFQVAEQNIKNVKTFYDKDTNISELKSCEHFVELVKGPFCLVNLSSIRSGLIEVNKEILDCFSGCKYDLNQKELVYLMLNSKKSTVDSWLKLYEADNNLDKFIEKKIFSSYYNLDDTKLERHMLELVSQVTDFKFWQDPKNCLLSINKAFADRKFNLKFVQKWNMLKDDDTIDKELQKLLNNFKENTNKIEKDPAYPPQITNPNVKNDVLNGPNTNMNDETFKITTYVDGSKTDHKTFYMLTNTKELQMKMEDIEELLVSHSLNEKEKYYLVCNLLLSKNYCHYILGNKKVLEANKNLFEKYKPAFRYIIGYAWISLYMEESLKKTKTKKTDRFIFDIGTANCLPVFPFCHENPYLNPYFTCMVSDSLVNYANNINGVKQDMCYQNGIVDLDEFKKRLNIFISGNSKIDLLAGGDWTNMVLTGGLMPAIIPKINPLMCLFKKISDFKVPITDSELNRFFQEYYSKSDIDIACNHKNIIDFINHVKSIRKIVYTNLSSNANELFGNNTTFKESDVQIVPNKSLAIYINSTILKEKCNKGEIPFTYEDIINNKNKRPIKFYFYELYLEQKKSSNDTNRRVLVEKINDEEFFEIIDYCEFDKTTLIINDVSFESEVINYRMPQNNSGIQMDYFIYNKKTKMAEEFDDGNDDFVDDCTDESMLKRSNKSNIFIRFGETLKYKITSKYLAHPFEVFRISNEEFFSCISRFHLPCVRSYYDGTTCYMLPSSITAYQTFTNIDFKYFVGSYDPISIIDKYRKRGYGTILNKSEINQYLSYVMTNGNYKRAYGLCDVKDVKDIMKILGSLDMNHEFFKPLKNVPEDFANNLNIKPEYLTVKTSQFTKEDLVAFYKKNHGKYLTEFVEKRTINSDGQVEPFKQWMVDACYDFIN